MSTMEKLMREYDQHAERFGAAGFTREHVQRIGDQALLTIWDMFVIFQQVRVIAPGGTYLEIGSHLGGSLRCAWEAAGDTIRYVAIDPFVAGLKYAVEWKQTFEANTAHIPKRFFQEYSSLVAKDIPDLSVDRLFVDGGHAYDIVKRDFLLYWPKVKLGGAMLVHDFNYSPSHAGVVQAIMETFVLQEIAKPFRSNIALIRREHGNEGLYVYGERFGIGEAK